MRKVYLILSLTLSITLFGFNVIVPFGPFQSEDFNQGKYFLTRGEVLEFDRDVNVFIPEDGKILKFYEEPHNNFCINVSNFLIVELFDGRILVYNNINYDKNVTDLVKKGDVLGSLLSDGDKYLPTQVIYYFIDESFNGNLTEALYSGIMEKPGIQVNLTIFNIFDFYGYSDLFSYSSGE